MTSRMLMPWRARRSFSLDGLDVLSLRCPFEYPGAKGPEDYRECLPAACE